MEDYSVEELEKMIDQADTYEGLVKIGKYIMKICVSEIVSADENKQALDPQARLKFTYLKTFERWTKIVKDASTKKDIEEVNMRLKALEESKGSKQG